MSRSDENAAHSPRAGAFDEDYFTPLDKRNIKAAIVWAI
jgi:hypothetical protein